mgnify:CR=1 FL=1
MSGQVGIPKYKDLLNKTKLNDLTNNIKYISLRFNMLASDKAVENRESDLFEQYTTQYGEDMQNIDFIRQYAQNIVNICNDMNFILSKRAIQYHVYEFDNDEIE